MIHNISSILRFFLVLLLLMVTGGSAWGQVIFVSSGVIDEAHVSKYNEIKTKIESE